MASQLLEILKNTCLITGLVMVMMLFIEYLNVRTQGHSLERLKRSPFGQIVLSAALGLIPGCIGGFAVVSLFTHGLFRFGALTAMTVATTGDEAFALLAMNPGIALLIAATLFILAVGVGWVTNRWTKHFPTPFTTGHYEVHSHEQECKYERFWQGIMKNFRNITFERALLLGGLLLFIVAMLSGLLEHSHVIDTGHVHSHHGHTEAGSLFFSERWLNLLFAGLSIVTFFLIAAVDNHFLAEHLWGHIIKKHFPKIFCWTLGTLLAVHLLLHYAAIDEWVHHNNWNMLLLLLAALLIGLIPQSGPHMLFVMLYANGAIPFSILLANCLVQDGHTALPLLAESPHAFIRVKWIKLIVGLIIGLCGYFFQF